MNEDGGEEEGSTPSNHSNEKKTSSRQPPPPPPPPPPPLPPALRQPQSEKLKPPSPKDSEGNPSPPTPQPQLPPLPEGLILTSDPPEEQQFDLSNLPPPPPPKRKKRSPTSNSNQPPPPPVPIDISFDLSAHSNISSLTASSGGGSKQSLRHLQRQQRQQSQQQQQQREKSQGGVGGEGEGDCCCSSYCGCYERRFGCLCSFFQNHCQTCCSCAYTPQVRKCLKDLLFEAIPIFIAASVSQFVQSIISYITFHSKGNQYPINLIIGQNFVYCLIIYIGGKYLTYYLQSQILQQEVDDRQERKTIRQSLRRSYLEGTPFMMPEKKRTWIQYFQQYQYIPLFFGILAENSSFAWKEFLVTVLFTFFYLNYGLGLAVFIFLLWIGICLLLIGFSYYFLHSVMKLQHDTYYEVLSDFNSDSFALSIAFSLTIIWAIVSSRIGLLVVDTSGYLFEWDELGKKEVTDDYYETFDDYTATYYYSSPANDDTNKDSSFNPWYFIYCVLITILIAIVFVAEERLGCTKFEEEYEEEQFRKTVAMRESLMREALEDNDEDGEFNSASRQNLQTVENVIHSQNPPEPEVNRISEDKIPDEEANNNNNNNINTAATVKTEPSRPLTMEIASKGKGPSTDQVTPTQRTWFFGFCKSTDNFRLHSLLNTYLDFWHTFLGYFSGVAWFALVIDELLSYDSGHPLVTVVILGIFSFLVSWRAPFLMAITMKKQEIAKEKFENFSEKSQSTSTSADGNGSTWKFPVLNCVYNFAKYFYHFKVHHKTIILMSVRLTLGWIWEVFIIKLLQFISQEKKYGRSAVVGFNFIAVIIILVISFLIHRIFHNIDLPTKSEMEEMQEQLQAEEFSNPMIPDPPVITKEPRGNYV